VTRHPKLSPYGNRTLVRPLRSYGPRPSTIVFLSSAALALLLLGLWSWLH